ncbi:MAG: glycerol-3-phosphate dehydrogenase/oxidase [Spirochaetes bacterium]|nr:glycerol-3-phosphate dehydrogenase/oxidase [Spirochaetota bacterium]
MKRFIEQSNTKEYDLIIIGAGITGASLAYEVSSRGYSVAVIDKGDFSCKTSSATSKLIHGGLRYLKNFELSLIRESLRERRILMNIAPNLVYPLQMLIPTYRDFQRSRLILGTGLTIYDLLAYDKKRTWDPAKKMSRHTSISRQNALDMEPDIDPHDLTGAMLFQDSQSLFPERLTLAFIKSAVKYGADVSNYAEVTEFIYSNSKAISGVIVKDKLTGNEKEIRGKLTVNCTGPWADILLNIAEKGKSTNHIKRSEGIHIITETIGNGHALLQTAKNGRHLFTLPWRGHSLIGTTDREYKGDPDEYRITRESIIDFIKDINYIYGSEKIKYKDIKFAYGGLRPMVESDTEGTYTTSRKYEIYDNAKDGYENLITVEGGKYTTSRNLAFKTANIIDKKFSRKPSESITDKNYLNGCDIKDIQAFIHQMLKTHKDLNRNTAITLSRYYGTEITDILKITQGNKNTKEPLNDDGEISAQVIYAVRNEMAKKLEDIIFRRTGFGTLGHPGKDVLKKIADTAAKELGWNKEHTRKEIEEAERLLMVP